jgi:thioredoxin-dependent peroxiredoxin
MALKVGDKLPLFVTTDHEGKTFDSDTIVGKKIVVLYFYPKDDTPACTAQACSLRDNYSVFKEFGAEVIGVSGDSTASHQKFISKFNLPFALLSDKDRKLRTLLGVPTSLFGLIPGRVTYVIDKKGIVRMIYDHLSDKQHLPKALEMVKQLAKEE